jgi:MFS-type transporter involved in bile tolerance (Atg22 family)
MDIPIMTKPMACASALAFIVMIFLCVLGSFLDDNISGKQVMVIGVVMVVLTLITLACLGTTFAIFELILFEGA